MGDLFVVATPIGNLGDLSDRARTVLASCSLIVAEDTRHTGKLLNAIGIATRMVSFNEHNLSRRIGPVLAELEIADVALVSDAGTPTISDPGYQLIAAAHEAGKSVRAVPGPSAVIAALSVSGLPATPFRFLGYPPRTGGQLHSFIERWITTGETTVLFEAPGRIAQTIGAIVAANPSATVVICRELTKLYEQVQRGSAEQIAQMLADGSIPARGEFVIVVRAESSKGEVDLDQLLRDRLDAGERPNQAARAIAGESGVSKSELYKRALAIKAADQPD